MSSFNICDLPLVPLEIVLKNVRPQELLPLSSMTQYPISMKTNGFYLKMTQKSAGIWMNSFSLSWEPTDVVKEVLEKYQELSNTYKGPLDVLDIDPQFVAQLENAVTIPSECRKLRLVSEGGNDSQEAVNRILGGMRMKELYYDVKDCEITQDYVFSVDELVIRSGSWMTPNDLLRCDNKFLHIWNHELDEHAVNFFLKKWLNGGNEKLEVALFEKEHSQDWDLSLVLAGIANTQFDVKNRDKFYFPAKSVPDCINDDYIGPVALDDVPSGVDLEFAMDIRRADGTWASVDVDRFSNQLRIFVWKDAHPSQFVIDEVEKECEELAGRIVAKLEFLFSEERSVEEVNAINRDVQNLENRFEANVVMIRFLDDNNCVGL